MAASVRSQALEVSEARLLRAARQQLRASALFGAEFVPLRIELAPAASFAAPPNAHAAFAATSEIGLQETMPVALPRPAPAAPPARPVPRSSAVHAASAAEPLLPRVIVEAKPRDPSPKQAEAQARLDALRAKYEADAPHKGFVTDHHCIVFGDGDPCARLMIIGEAPGAEEDKVGLPFVGRAGQLLEKMLGAMGLARSQVYITNVLKTRPPNNATPTADEAAACAPYLFEQIKIISPECILSLGLPATRVLLNAVDSMSRLRGRWWNYADPRTLGYEVPVMPTYHPAFLLRSYTRENREKVWSDLQMVMQKLGLRSGAPAS